VVISDFGISTVLKEGSRANTFCGTSFYLAPEIIQKNEYSYEVDLWSMGCLTYFLYFPLHTRFPLCPKVSTNNPPCRLFHSPPFEGEVPEIFTPILAGRFSLERDPPLSDDGTCPPLLCCSE